MASAYPIPFGKHLRGIKEDGCADFAGEAFWSDGFLRAEYPVDNVIDALRCLISSK